MSLLLKFSIQKCLPPIMRQFNRNVTNAQRVVSNFPADQEWFDRANRIIANQFGPTLSSSIESNFIDCSKADNAIQQIVSEELLSAVAILQDRIGEKSNETLLDIERKCHTGIGLNNFFQSTANLLMSCIDGDHLSVDDIATTAMTNKLEQKKILDNQIALAILSEMMHITTVLHNQICDNAHQKCDQVGNKILIILGDYFMAQMLFRLGNFEQPNLARLFISILQYRSEAFFHEQAVADNALQSTIEHWTELNDKKFANLFACNFSLVLKLNKIDDPSLNEKAFEFGRNLGLAISAFQCINWSLENELPSSAITQQAHSNTKIKQNCLVNVQANYELIKEEQQAFCATAQAQLELLPLQNDAKECFHKLLLNCSKISV